MGEGTGLHARGRYVPQRLETGIARRDSHARSTGKTAMIKRSPLVDSFPDLGPNICFIGSSSSKSSPVINQSGLSALNANVGRAQNVVDSTFQPYGGQFTAPLSQAQNQAGGLLQFAPSI